MICKLCIQYIWRAARIDKQPKNKPANNYAAGSSSEALCRPASTASIVSSLLPMALRKRSIGRFLGSIDEAWMVPFLISFSDFISAFASGMTIKFFPLFFLELCGLKPMSQQLLSAMSPLCISFASAGAQRLSKVGYLSMCSPKINKFQALIVLEIELDLHSEVDMIYTMDHQVFPSFSPRALRSQAYVSAATLYLVRFSRGPAPQQGGLLINVQVQDRQLFILDKFQALITSKIKLGLHYEVNITYMMDRQRELCPCSDNTAVITIVRWMIPTHQNYHLDVQVQDIQVTGTRQTRRFNVQVQDIQVTSTRYIENRAKFTL